MARTNLHELASRLLDCLDGSSLDGTFEGKLRSVAAEAGLNSVRSAEAVKLLEDLDRIEVIQRGRRGRDTIIRIKSTEPITLDQAESRLPSRTTRRAARLNYEDLGKTVVDRLLELGRDDALRTAQVEAFAAESDKARKRIAELENAIEEANERETDLRIRLRTAEESLVRAEENLRRAFGAGDKESMVGGEAAHTVPDDEARAVLDILRSGHS
jgi:hypothetical protein